MVQVSFSSHFFQIFRILKFSFSFFFLPIWALLKYASVSQLSLLCSAYQLHPHMQSLTSQIISEWWIPTSGTAGTKSRNILRCLNILSRCCPGRKFHFISAVHNNEFPYYKLLNFAEKQSIILKEMIFSQKWQRNV